MISKIELINELLKIDSDISYDNEKNIVYYKEKQVDFDAVYNNFLRKNGMSFNCICDVHWECMSILECTECGTIIKYYYDEYYEPTFKCPVCTDYKTNYEYHTKEEIESSQELKTVIDMYKDLNRIQKEQSERIKSRNGLLDSQLCNAVRLNTKTNTYDFQLLIDSITNKNILQGLRLCITKYEKNSDGCMTSKWFKDIPLSIEALQYYRYRKFFEKNPELDPLEQLKGKTLSQTMEENAIKKLKK